jgi:hypothetical protein
MFRVGGRLGAYELRELEPLTYGAAGHEDPGKPVSPTTSRIVLFATSGVRLDRTAQGAGWAPFPPCWILDSGVGR